MLTIRVPKGTRRRLERRARAENPTLSQYVGPALDTEALFGALEAARADLVPIARAKDVYTDRYAAAFVAANRLAEGLAAVRQLFAAPWAGPAGAVGRHAFDANL